MIFCVHVHQKVVLNNKFRSRVEYKTGIFNPYCLIIFTSEITRIKPFLMILLLNILYVCPTLSENTDTNYVHNKTSNMLNLADY